MKNIITIDMIDDWAGAAMQGLIASRERNKELDIEELANVAYEIASEMARARGDFIETYGDELDEAEQEQSSLTDEEE